ncbi:hypothetical protein WISP_33307 [Willisornis vidua]|uniref:Uncharacterized protein n=1 Tax=Willisornis vidua TaxID=1566151 RepID=A0ABQ9DJI0_9PASS|nr:hypothetical protein WISP_33307 [Willisornis vidua]
MAMPRVLVIAVQGLAELKAKQNAEGIDIKAKAYKTSAKVPRSPAETYLHSSAQDSLLPNGFGIAYNKSGIYVWWLVVTVCYSSDTSGLKHCLVHLSSWTAELDEQCAVVWQWAAERLSEFMQKGRGTADAEKLVLMNSCAKATALTQKEADRSLLQLQQRVEASTMLSFARCQVSA